jgi:selenocysteine-specific elongation factor
LKRIILGTAGHIDHGKTSLIKALTGIDTDRLKEEKLRGITIELGFAFLDLPGAPPVGIVDVPGHERFVKNMVAGATGIDLVMLVVAADEGVMPQTTEHMEICTLLDVRHGLIALTKTDLVDEEWLELVQEDIRTFTQDTFLEEAPLLPVSAVTGQGLDALREALAALCAVIPERPPSSILRLPIDRVFSMKGFGTVITGTLISGRVELGDAVTLYPSGIASKVRGIQVHNDSVTTAEAGMRTAINLQGLEKSAIERGEVMARPGTLKPSYMVDVKFQFLKSNPKPMKDHTRVRFHVGTSEVIGNVILLDREELSPGETAVAQIRLEKAITAIKGDRCVLRSYSPVRTIGGGSILNPIPKKHKRFKKDLVSFLHRIAEDPPEAVALHHIRESGFTGIGFQDLLLMTQVTEKALQRILQQFLSDRQILMVDKDSRIFLHADNFERFMTATADHLKRYHRQYPLRSGMPKEELRSKFPKTVHPKIFHLAVTEMLEQKVIVQEEQTVRMADHTVALGEGQQAVRKRILAAYERAGLMPPYFSELCKDLDLDPKKAGEILSVLVDEGRLVKVKENLFFDTRMIEDLIKRLKAFFQEHEEITTPQFKEMTGASRKFVIPLLEYFDAKNITLRVGDARKLRMKPVKQERN